MDKERDETGAKKKNGPRTPEDGISREGIINELKQIFEEGGAFALLSNARQLREDWQKHPLRIGVIGRSGSGKSSFINAFRGLREADDGAAEVDIVQATSKLTPYYHPDMACLELWDLPGVGTPDFEKPNYLKAIEFQKYDFYIVVSCDRFTDDDLWFSEEIHRAGKRFYFVRTKLDIALESDQRSKRPSGSIDGVIDRLRKDCESHLGNVEMPRVYVVSNILEKNMGEMEALKHHLSEDESGFKREILQLTMTAVSTELIQQKEKILKKWAFAVALHSAAVAGIPLPGVSLAVDMGLLKLQSVRYKRQFGVDGESLRRISHLIGVSDKDFVQQLHFESVALSTAAGLMKFVASLASEITESTVRIAIPIIGSVIAGAVSYSSTVYILRKMIGEYANDARKICAFAKNKV